ncbi:hypothetical protein A3F65_00185 [Candidatus Saccharibacteria bacterium RIFCSPHIGHO2_12_FULL_47_16b]|nr:MAG: hypothetical protein A3F65_00185 [Candidatus Saccharibacteria bacterium RIFCSPHIGHO2_12_FULL_47_16b]
MDESLRERVHTALDTARPGFRAIKKPGETHVFYDGNSTVITRVQSALAEAGLTGFCRIPGSVRIEGPSRPSRARSPALLRIVEIYYSPNGQLK